MGAFQAVMLSALTPVRRAVPLQRGNPADSRLLMEQLFEGRRITLYASGTAALSQAIAECVARSSVKDPEVILPAYGCPDLIAACIQASAHPRLVDLVASVWKYDPESLTNSLTRNTVAVVAVNLLGIGDDSTALHQWSRKNQILLIQDSAQFLPRTANHWPGDYIVLSFGRGKPMNLLHGGALIRPQNACDVPPPICSRFTWRDQLLGTRLAAIAFNVLTRPHIYWVLSLLPGTGFGQVIYKPIRNTVPVPNRAWRQVGRAFELYCMQQSYSRTIWDQAIDEWEKLGITPLRCPASLPHPESLRLALLASDRTARDHLVAQLNRHGLGASRLYGCTIDRIARIPEVIQEQGPFPNATAVADRLFTLPTHTFVTEAAVASTRRIVSTPHRPLHAQ